MVLKKDFFVARMIYWMAIVSYGTELQALQGNASQTNPGHETHGGDLIECKKHPENKFLGFYSYDYLTSYSDEDLNEDVRLLEKWVGEDSYSERLLKILAAKYPEMGVKFEDFLKYRSNTKDPTLPQIWERSPDGLPIPKSTEGLDDSYQDGYRRLPLNCYSGYDPKKDPSEQQNLRLIDFRRAITFITEANQKVIRYAFDPYLISKVNVEGNSERMVNYSFLMIHEFLRQFTGDHINLRAANRLLHSSLIENESFNLKEALSIYKIKVNSEMSYERRKIEFFVHGPFIGSYSDDDKLRQQAVDGFKKKCDEVLASIKLSLGEDLFEDVDSCDYFHVGKLYRAFWDPRYTNSRRLKSVVEPVRFKDAFPDSRSSDQLGYQAWAKLEVTIKNTGSLFIETKSIPNLKIIPFDFHNKDDIVMAVYKYQAHMDEACSNQIKSLKNDYNERLKLVLCDSNIPGADEGNNQDEMHYLQPSTSLDTVIAQ